MENARKFLEKRFDYILSKDIDRLMKEQYHDDVVMLSLDRKIKLEGKSAIQQAFEKFVEDEIESVKVGDVMETEDVIYFSATINRRSGVLHAQEAFYLKEGKIFRQFSHEEE
ncbi:MAG: hypothetical protein KAI84_00895 [Gammaproteobacteria bacterium]|nr:hypothetical protein [Gammaproteobacteria bacterium]